MMRMKYRSILPVFFFFCISFSSGAQDITGIWKGYFISDGGDYYKLEFQVARNGSTGVTGVSYSYLDIRFYGKATMTGSFIKSSASFKIKEIKTVEVKSSLGGSTCIMNYNFTYSRSGNEEFLDGTYLGKFEVPGQSNVTGQWGDCGGGTVHLRRVTSSDFYIEPFLKNKLKRNTQPVIDNEPPRKSDSIKTKPPVAKVIPPVKKPVTTKPPVSKPPVAKTNPPVKKPVTTKPPVTKPVVKTNPPANNTKPVAKVNVPPPVTKPPADTIKKTAPPVTKVTPPPVKIPDVLKTRTNELVRSIAVNDPQVTVKLFDNGQIDGDTISVYLDKKLVLGNKMLTASPLVVHFTIQPNEEHELIMVAENLGTIPPNTSLMIVESGDQRLEVRITSTEQKNALVRFRYQPK